jgi:hypothetical protein
MGFRSLRVINEDRVAPGEGFGTHPHRDMEIVSYVVEGALAHEDSMGNGSVIRSGEVQRMSAGTGVTHSELNPSPDAPLHFFQLWFVPDRKGYEPSYEQRAFPDRERQGTLRLVVSPDGRDGSLTIHQDVRMYSGLLGTGDVAHHRLAAGRHAWLQVVRGRIEVGGAHLERGDGAAIEGEPELTLKATEDSEVLLFDLA